MVHGRVLLNLLDRTPSDAQPAEYEDHHPPKKAAKSELLVVASTPGGRLGFFLWFFELNSGPVRVEPEEYRYVSGPGHRSDVLLHRAQLDERGIVNETVMRKLVGGRVARDLVQGRYYVDKV